MVNLGTLNPQQREAVESLSGPVLILAGAGTGKTRVITMRVAHLIDRGAAPGGILAVTFTNKAAREMVERVSQWVPRPPRGRDGERAERPTICTFHSLCVRILRGHIERLGYKRNFTIYDEGEQLGVIKKILSQISARGERADPQAVLGLLSRLRNNGPERAGFRDPGVRALAEHVQRRYESALRACNAVDFDDLILLTLRLFREHADALAACRARYRHVMVDEYQDTNAAQFELVHALTREHRQLCVVGDDDQSIHGWRGAETANLLEFERHYPEVKVIKLEQNYRSTDTILQAANAVIRHNVRRRGKQLWSSRGRGVPIALWTHADDEAEARAVVEEIEFARQGRRVPWAEHAVLFRTNQQSRPLEAALRKAGVRYHLVGGQSFFDRREVRDLMAYLKVCVNAHDDISLLRIANVPARGMSDVTLQRLLAASQERKSSVYSAMKNPAVMAALPARAQAAVDGFVALIDRAADALRHGPAGDAHALERWAGGLMTDIGYVEDLRRSEKDPETAENRVRNFRELLSSLDGEGRGGLPLAERLEQFLEEVTLDTEREAEDEAIGDSVTLITMHSCKGLEFPHVFIVGLEEGLLPHARSVAEGGTLDEERRLFYVAITRAMQTLTLSHCGARRKYGQLAPAHPSRFLRELPPDLIERPGDMNAGPASAEAGRQWFAAMRANLGEPGAGGSR